jgi:hypothetical protein
MKKAIEAARWLVSKFRVAGAKSTNSRGYSVIVWARPDCAPPVLSYCSDRDATIEDHALAVQTLIGSAVQFANDDGRIGLKPIERWGRSGRERLR